MAKMTLMDVARVSDSLSQEELISNPDMNAYVTEMQEVGLEVLKSLNTDELAVVVSLMEAMFSYSVLQSHNPMLAMILLADQESFSDAMSQALKIAVGIVLSEEWR